MSQRKSAWRSPGPPASTRGFGSALSNGWSTPMDGDVNALLDTAVNCALALEDALAVSVGHRALGKR